MFTGLGSLDQPMFTGSEVVLRSTSVYWSEVVLQCLLVWGPQTNQCLLGLRWSSDQPGFTGLNLSSQVYRSGVVLIPTSVYWACDHPHTNPCLLVLTLRSSSDQQCLPIWAAHIDISFLWFFFFFFLVSWVVMSVALSFFPILCLELWIRF